jgi:hypothetical protein
MIRVAIDLFLLDGEEYVAVSEAIGLGCEIVQTREMVWPGPWSDIDRERGPLIAEMTDPDEEREERERQLRHLWRIEADEEYARWYNRHERQRERDELAVARRAHREAPDASFFWLPKVTANSPNDLHGRHWYPFSGPPPERQQWLVWREINKAYRPIVAAPSDWMMPHAWPELPETDVTFHVRAEQPAVAAREALGRLQGFYRTMPYEQYLDTPHWHRTRYEAIQRADYTCEECHAYRPRMTHLEVHHLTYARRGKELPDDLRVLCSDCHAKVHGKPAREG